MTRLRCFDCQDGRHCRHRGYVPAGTILALCRCVDCDPQPIQARLFSHTLVENTLGPCADCDQPACKLLVGGAGQPDTSLPGRAALAVLPASMHLWSKSLAPGRGPPENLVHVQRVGGLVRPLLWD